jgi:hypothetical protein
MHSGPLLSVVSGSLVEGGTQNEDKRDAGERAKGVGEDVQHGCVPCPLSNPAPGRVCACITDLRRRVAMLPLALPVRGEPFRPMLIHRQHRSYARGAYEVHADGWPSS